MSNKTLYFILATIVVLASLSTIDFNLKAESSVASITQQETSYGNYLSGNTQCTQKLAVQCAIQVQQTVRACATAFQTQGADVIADIKCAKDLMADKKFCWPCICYEAKKRQWKIIGC